MLVKTGTVQQAILKGNDPIETMRNKFGNLMDSIIYMPKVLWYSLPDIPGYIKDFNASIHPPIYEMIFDSTTLPVFEVIKEMNHSKTKVLAMLLAYLRKKGLHK